MAGRTRRKLTNTGTIPPSSKTKTFDSWCRKCMQMKSSSQFYDATDHLLDTNGKMSICKDCINDLFMTTLQSEIDLNRTFLKVCRTLNIAYNEEAIGATLKHKETIENKGTIVENLFSIYKMKIVSVAKRDISRDSSVIDLTFCEPQFYTQINPITEDDEGDVVDVKKRWGTNYTDEQYDWLEFELSNWQKSHKCDTQAEETLLIEICHKKLEIRTEREGGKAAASKVKELQDLMKTANVDPAKTAIAGGGKSQDTFSSFIKTIENEDPAEYYKDKELFKDFDNIGWYFRKYITRPLKNFITQSRDFNIEYDDGDDDDDFTVEESIVSSQEE